MTTVLLDTVDQCLSRPGMLEAVLSSLLTQFGASDRGSHKFHVYLKLGANAASRQDQLTVEWDVKTLLRIDPGLRGHLMDLQERGTPIVEHVTEYAGLGMAMCAVRAYLPGAKITHFNRRRAPDLWLALDESAGIEAAGRSSGRSNYDRALREKRSSLRTRVDLKQAYLSVWGFDLGIGCKERVR